MKIRKLNAGDVRRMAALLAKNLSIFQTIEKKEGENREDYAARVGQEVVSRLLSHNLEEVWEWLADLAGMTVEEFNKADLDAPVEVIEALTKEEDLRGFFSRVQQLVAKAQA